MGKFRHENLLHIPEGPWHCALRLAGPGEGCSPGCPWHSRGDVAGQPPVDLCVPPDRQRLQASDNISSDKRPSDSLCHRDGGAPQARHVQGGQPWPHLQHDQLPGRAQDGRFEGAVRGHWYQARGRPVSVPLRPLNRHKLVFFRVRSRAIFIFAIVLWQQKPEAPREKKAFYFCAWHICCVTVVTAFTSETCCAAANERAAPFYQFYDVLIHLQFAGCTALRSVSFNSKTCGEDPSRSIFAVQGLPSRAFILYPRYVTSSKQACSDFIT